MGRARTFEDPRVVQLATETFVPVVGDDWYQRRRRDPQGEFFRAVANQGPRKHDGPGGPTRQGFYLLTATGKLLGYRNHSDPAVMLQVIEEALAVWRALPAADRAPGAIEVPSLDREQLDARYHREPPPNGLVLRVHARVLERDENGALRRCASVPSGLRGLRSGRDHMWIREAEWRALVPAPGQRGEVEVPFALFERFARFHLVDTTRGEPPLWRRGDLHEAEVAVRIVRNDGDLVELALSGRVSLVTPDGGRRYEPAFTGRLVFSRKADRFTAFDVAAVGDHSGDGQWNRGARAGAAPLGIVCTLLDADTPSATIPPQGARDLGSYYGR